MEGGEVESTADAGALAHAVRAPARASIGSLRALLDAARVAMIASDADGRVVAANAGAERLLGQSADALATAHVETLVAPPFRAAYREQLASCIAACGSRSAGPAMIAEASTKDGHLAAVELSVGTVETDSGLVAITTLRDLGEERRAAAALELARADLEAFRHTVAHDLRAPLRAVASFARLLAEGHAERLDDEGRDWLREVCAGADRMTSFVEALLSLSNVTRASLRRVSVDVSELAQSLLGRLAQAEPTRRVEIAVEHGLAADLDPLLARTLFEALLGNAWKFTSGRAPARIEVGATTAGDERVFFVRDDGAGFNPAFTGKLFVPFQRLHAIDEYPGVGMGLAIARRIVVRHGGRIWAEGQPGRGACFFFTLPASRV